MVYCKGCDSYEQNKPEPMTQDEKIKNVFINEYVDIMVKVESDVYHLNKLQLVLKSDYFEKLFIDDFQEKNSDLIELPFIDSKTFSAIVDIIYGKKLKQIINDENCVPVLMAMDYLQMEIDLQVFANFIGCYYGVHRSPMKPMNTYIFKLHDLIVENRNFNSLFPSVFQYLSSNLLDFRGREEFLDLPFDSFIRIISIRDSNPTFEGARKFVDFCVDWIWHDVENRLQYTFDCVNAGKRRFDFPYGVNDEKPIVNLKSPADQKMKRETLAKYFCKQLLYEGCIDAATEDSESNPSPYNNFPKKLYRIEHERTKWARFLETGDLYDIMVKVEEKTYKLHRMKLMNSKRGSVYFENLFKSERLAAIADEEIALSTAIRPNKDKEYFLDGVDRKSFDWIVKYIYLDEKFDSQLTSDSMIGVLKAANILKMCHLEWTCFHWAIDNIEKIGPDAATEILELTHGKNQFDNFHKIYFRKRVPLDWPEIGDNVPLFCSVSFEVLEEILVSETLHFDGLLSSSSSIFCIEDQNKLLDICSKWIAHDVKNRYHLIPQIALAINCNGTVDCNDYQIGFPTNLANCSQQTIRDKLWDILCCTCLVPAEASSREFENDPVFISKTARKINFLNAEMDRIASLEFFAVSARSHFNFLTVLSAAMVKDNVFILSESLCFQVYNISSKKFISLARVPRLEARTYDLYNKCILLNCRDEIYCCFRNGYLLKYSPQLNRWTKLSYCEIEEGVQYASDGKQIYRIYILSRKERSVDSPGANIYVIDVFDFDQNVWNSLPNMSLEMNDFNALINLIIVNDIGLVALFKFNLFVFDEDSQCWLEFGLPDGYLFQSIATLAQARCVDENRVLYVLDNKLYHIFGTDQNRNYEEWYWDYQKEFSYSNENIVAIHRPEV